MSGPINRKFVSNSLWSVLGVTVNVLVGLVLSPYMVRLLGPERFGVWALVFSILDYFWIFDLGLTPAINNLLSRARARGDAQKVNEVVNTASFYFLLIAALIWLATAVFGPRAVTLFKIPPARHHEFTILICMTGFSWGLCVAFQMYQAALDAFQRFDLTNRVTMAAVVTRSIGYVVVLLCGGSLVWMGAVFVLVQLFTSVAHLRNFKLEFQNLRYSPQLVSRGTFKEILRYGLPAFGANASSLFLGQSGPVIIGHFLPTAFVAFYVMPLKLVGNLSDVVSRLSLVTRSRVAELDENRDSGAVAEFVELLNRYCFGLYVPLLIFVALFGHQFLALWMGPQFASYSAPLLPILIAANALVLGGQYNSGAALFGMARHDRYATMLAIEAGALLASLVLVVPRHGITGAAWATALLMITVRGVLTPALLCSELGVSLSSYLGGIYARPALTGLGVYGLMTAVQQVGLDGRSWFQLAVAGAMITVLFAVAGAFTCLSRAHRASLLSAIWRLGGLQPLRA